MSLYDDGLEQSVATKSSYQDEVNRKIKALEAENSLLRTAVEIKVVNRRTGAVRTKTVFQVNDERREACIKRYWTRIPRSNSLMFEYNTLK